MSFLNWFKVVGGRVKAKVPAGHFAIGHEWLPFGSTLVDLETRGIAGEGESLDKSNMDLDVYGNIFGMEYVSIAAFCFGINRPIETLWHKLPFKPSEGHLGTIRQGQRHLMNALGRPTTASGDISDICITSEGDVVFHAVWRLKHCLWGVSWYGNTRHENGRALSGMLYLQWDDEKSAAKPYLPEFRLELGKLDRMPVPTVIARLLDNELARPFIRKWYHVGAVTDPAKDPSLIEAQRALYTPRLLFTPRNWLVELQINANGELVVWRSICGLLGISTPCDTWVTKQDEFLVIDEYLTRPAKGPGRHSVRIGEINVSVDFVEGGNPAMNDFIAAIKSMDKTEYRFHESSDC